MPREIVTCTLNRKSQTQPWGFRVVGGTDEALILKVDKVRINVYFGFEVNLPGKIVNCTLNQKSPNQPWGPMGVQGC